MIIERTGKFRQVKELKAGKISLNTKKQRKLDDWRQESHKRRFTISVTAENKR